MSNEVNQTVSTRNQSTANYQQKKVFLWDNHYKEAILNNNTGAMFTAKTGQIVMRNSANPNQVIPITSSDDINLVVGITVIEDSVNLSNGGTLPINIATKGTIDGNALELSNGVTLNSVVNGKSLSDFLEGIGFHVDTSTVEHTDFDN